jgi:hypothetical protein
VNVSVAVTASHAIAASAPMVISRTMSPPHVPFGRPGENIPKSRLDPVTHVTGRGGFARAEKPHGIEARRLRAAPDLNCGHNSAQFPPLSPPLRTAVGCGAKPAAPIQGCRTRSRNRPPCDGALWLGG